MAAILTDGYDDSRWEPEVDDNALAVEGKLHFGIHKISEGISYKDPTWEDKVQGSAQIQMPQGGFHYFHPNLGALEQAHWCYDCARGYADLHTVSVDAETPLLGLAEGNQIMRGITSVKPKNRGRAHYENYHLFGMRSIITETNSIMGGMSYTERLLQFRNELHRISGWKVILYSSPAFLNAWLDPVTDWELWLAHYTAAAEPDLPPGWRRDQIRIWQWTDKGKSAGFPGTSVDLNRFYGTPKDVVTYFGNGVEKPMPITEVPTRVKLKTASSYINLRSAPTYPDSNLTTVVGRANRLDGAGRITYWYPVGREYDSHGRAWLRLATGLYLAEWLTQAV